jgi:hypothetical protein
LEKEILGLFKYSRGTYYSWKKEKRPVISLIEKYFTEKDLQEFINTGIVSKLEVNSNHGIKLSLVNEYLSFVKPIINFVEDEIKEITEQSKDNLLFIYFDFINFVKSYDQEELLCLIDDLDSREIALKELLMLYLKKYPQNYSPFVIHHIGNFNLIIASYIIEVLVKSFSDFYKHAGYLDYKSVYIHLIFDKFYKKEISIEELKKLYSQNKERVIKDYLKTTANSNVL